MEVIFSQVAGVAGCTLNQLNAWSLRGLLKTKLLPTTAGVARKFTRKNALELAFLAAISDAGMPLELAPQLVRRWLREAGKGILKPFFVYYPVSGNSIYLDDTNLNRLAVLFYDNQDDVSGEWIDENASPDNSLPAELNPASRFNVIALCNIVTSIDKLFMEKD